MIRIIIARNISYSLLSGLLLVYCFPQFNLNWLIWIAMVPLLEMSYTELPRKAFFYGWLFGICFMGGVTYWLTILPGGYIGWLAYCLFYALYPAIFCGILSWIKLNFKRKNLIPYITPFLWVSIEWLRARGFMGFTWTELGHSQFNFSELIQIASITGVMGISLLIISVNELLREIISFKFPGWFKSGNLKKKKEIIIYTVSVVVLFVIYIGYGLFELKTFPVSVVSPVKIAVIQPNIIQGMKWDPRHINDILEKYFRMTRMASTEKPDIILWPETAIPGYLLENQPLTQAVSNLAIDTHASLLIGAIDMDEQKKSIFNSAILFSSGGKITEKYNKMHLVPFGEYLPGRKIFEAIPYMKNLIKPISHFSSGEKMVLFKTPGLNFCTVICFESIFPEIARKGMSGGAECIVVLTNDAWFERSAAPYQHNIISVFRAIENHTFVVRCANTGVSSVIDPLGRILESTPIYEDKIIYAEVYPHPATTFFTFYGDLFAILSLCISIFPIFYTIWLNRFKREKMVSREE